MTVGAYIFCLIALSNLSKVSWSELLINYYSLVNGLLFSKAAKEAGHLNLSLSRDIFSKINLNKAALFKNISYWSAYLLQSMSSLELFTINVKSLANETNKESSKVSAELKNSKRNSSTIPENLGSCSLFLKAVRREYSAIGFLLRKPLRSKHSVMNLTS